MSSRSAAVPPPRAGGVVRTSTPVAAIGTRRGAVTGVRLKDGEELIGTNTEGGTVNQYGGTATPNGSVYSQSQGGQTARWQVQGGRLFVDLGAGPQPVALSVARNSNGYPIITADGTEYSQCR